MDTNGHEWGRRWMTAVAGLVVGGLVVALLPEGVLFTEGEGVVQEVTGERWACPMMDFIGNKPGECPVCGMTMQKVTAGELTREQQRRMGVETTVVSEGHATATVRAYGSVRYDDRTAQVVIARVAGRVVKRHAAAMHMGTFVNAGDPVVDLYSPEVFAAQGELAAAAALGDRRVIDALTQRFERLNLGAVAEAILAGGAPVDTITIRSPLSGRVVLASDPEADVVTRLPQVGQEIGADTPLLRLVEPYSFMLVVYVPETRARWIAEGQPVNLSSDDFGELPEVEASVAWVSPELTRDIRAREVHIHLRDPEGRLMAGSLVNARFRATLGADLRVADAQSPETWGTFVLVPKTAVISTGVRHVAWRVASREQDGRVRFELAPLALGPRLEDEFGNDLYVVRAGLAVGDEVATQGGFLIDSQAQLAGTASLLFPEGAVAPGVSGGASAGAASAGQHQH
jgi:Cu(I)/Ag(I) efflux system membrane fusion protein